MPLTSGKFLVDTILRTVFGRPVETRMRTGYFPFVEPGFEIDMRCTVCGGAGCRTCRQVGWLEVMPGGAPHPNVLRAGGLDPAEWTGFYVNIGLDRLVLMRYGIDDVRLMHSADIRFLSQFKSGLAVKISLDWISDYVNLAQGQPGRRELARQLTLKTVEVEDTVDLAAGLGDVVVGYVTAADQPGLVPRWCAAMLVPAEQWSPSRERRT